MASPESQELKIIGDELARIKKEAREAFPPVAALRGQLAGFKGILGLAGIPTEGIKMPSTHKWGGRYRRSYLESFGMEAAEQLPPYLQPYAAGALKGTAIPKAIETMTLAAGGAQNLQRVINAASTALGGMDLGFKNITKAITDANGTNFMFREGLNRTVISMDNLGNITVKAGRAARDFFDMVTRNIGKVIQWAIAVGLVYGAIQKVSQVMEDMKEFQNLFADIAIVMGTTSEAATQYFGAMYEVATMTGVTVKEVAKSLDDALRVTADIADETERYAVANQLLLDAMTLARIANIDSVQAFDMLVGALRQTGMELDEGSKLLDKWVAVSRVAKTEVTDLAQGFAITAQAAQTAGVDVDQLSGMIAGMTEVTTLSATQAGNAIRAFMSSFTTERSITALSRYGFAVKDLDGNFRSLWEILSEVAAAYETGALSPTGLKEITDAIGGGYRRAAQIEALIKGWPKVQYAAAISMKAHGEAADALGIKMETLQTAINKMTSAWQRLAEVIMEAGLIEDLTRIVDVMTDLLDIVSNLTEKLGPFLIRLGEIAALFGVLSFVGSKFGFSMGMGAGAAATQMALPGMGVGIMAGAAAKAGGLAGPLALGAATVAPLVIEAVTEGLTDEVTWKTAGTLLGGAVGFVLMGPWGAAIGAAIGQGILGHVQRERAKQDIPLAERPLEQLVSERRDVSEALERLIPIRPGLPMEYEALAKERERLEGQLRLYDLYIEERKNKAKEGLEEESNAYKWYYGYIYQLEKDLGRELPSQRERTMELLRRYAAGEVTRAEYRASVEQLEQAYNTIFVAFDKLGEELGVTLPEMFEILAATSVEAYDEIIARVNALKDLGIAIVELQDQRKEGILDEMRATTRLHQYQQQYNEILEESVLIWEAVKKAAIIKPELPPIFDFREIVKEDLPMFYEAVAAKMKEAADLVGMDFKDMFEETSYLGITAGFELFLVDPSVSRQFASLVMRAWEEAAEAFDLRRIKDIGEMPAQAWFDKLTGLIGYYRSLFATLGYFPEEQEIIMMLGPQNEIFRIVTSLDALRFAIEDLREVEEKQLEGQWNLPAGAVAWVPITSLYYQRQQAAGLPSMPGVPGELTTPIVTAPFDIPSRFGAAKWEDLIYQYATAAGIDPKIVAAIMQIESGGVPGAVGEPTQWGRAIGLMQVMPFHQWRTGGTLSDPEENIKVGIQILKEQIEKYPGELLKAIAGYTGGVIGGQITPTGADYLKTFREAFANLFGTDVLTAEGMPTGAVTQNIVEIPPIEIPPIYGEFTIHNYIVLEGAIIERFVNRILAEALTRYRRSGGTAGAGGPSKYF